MSLAVKYPKLFDKLEDKEVEVRHLLNVDENYEDFDSEEYEFNFEEYNYVIYVAELIQEALGKEKMEEFMVKLHDKDAFINFLASENDLYGVKSTLSKDEVVDLVLELVEEVM